MFISRTGVALNKIWARQVQGIMESQKPTSTPNPATKVLTEAADAPVLCEDTGLTEMGRLRQNAARGAYRPT
jgi:hypothetical protein